MAGKKKTAHQLEVPVSKLRWRCDPDRLGFDTTENLQESPDIIGQRRAVKALQLGLDIESQGYNVFVNGLPGSGRKTAVKKLLKETGRYHRIPDDKIFVNNFDNPDQPILIRLPAGKGRLFKKDMADFVEFMLKQIPELFDSESYQEKRKEKIELYKERQKNLIKNFEDEIAKENFALIQMQVAGAVRPAVLPLLEGKPTNFDQIRLMEKEGKITSGEITKLENTYSTLMDRLENVFDDIRDMDKSIGDNLRKLDQDIVEPLVDKQIRDLKERYDNPGVTIYLNAVKASVKETPQQFMPQTEEASDSGKNRPREERDPFLDFRINLLVDNNGAEKAPVIFETSPSYSNLFGTVEVTPDRHGSARTDFMKIKAGSFLKADGGFLVVEALDLLTEPGVWPAFKRTLKNRQVEIQIYAPVYMVSISAMKPEPIACDVKVAIVGSPMIYQILYNQDPDFRKIFKMRADFDTVMEINPHTMMDYASFMKRLANWEGLAPLDKHAVAAVLEHGVRLAGKQGKLSTQFNQVADILREAHYLARKDQQVTITEIYIRKAIEDKLDRLALAEEKMREMIRDGSVMIDVTGSATGQVNGLAVYDMGDYSFGKPSRITAVVAVGDSGVINIEREAELSGQIHNKGVYILTGYLRSLFAQDKPLCMSASLCFEQSYSGVDGDSASSTEIYALLSALSGLPLRQDLAVTGSVNQKGEIQPIGGVNQKIEGFFMVCKENGLTGDQGVMIPHQNVDDLMLREEIAEAVKNDKFHVYAIKTIAQGIELLTGSPLGERQKDGIFPENTVGCLVDRKLREYAHTWKQYRS